MGYQLKLINVFGSNLCSKLLKCTKKIRFLKMVNSHSNLLICKWYLLSFHFNFLHLFTYLCVMFRRKAEFLFEHIFYYFEHKIRGWSICSSNFNVLLIVPDSSLVYYALICWYYTYLEYSIQIRI